MVRDDACTSLSVYYMVNTLPLYHDMIRCMRVRLDLVVGILPTSHPGRDCGVRRSYSIEASRHHTDSPLWHPLSVCLSVCLSSSPWMWRGMTEDEHGVICGNVQSGGM